MLRRPALLLATGALALAATPALAQAAAPALGGLATALDGWLAPSLATAATGAVGWIAARYHRLTGAQMSATMTADVRETALTGLHVAAHELGVQIDRALPQDKREELVGRAVAWVMARLPGPLAFLRFGEPVVRGIAVKMLAQAIAGSGGEGDTVLNMAPASAADLLGWGLGRVSPQQPTTASAVTDALGPAVGAAADAAEILPKGL